MELRTLKTFCEVVERKSFSKTAQAICLTQSTVSIQINSLEKELGLRLLDRLDRKVLPTPQGEILYQHAKRILAQTEQIKNELTKSSQVRGRLNIGCGVTIGEGIMPQVIGSFKKKYPQTEFTLWISDTSEITKRIVRCELDLGIVGVEISHKDIILEEFTRDRLILIVYPAHPLRKKKYVNLSALLSEPFIVREEGSGTRMHVRRELRKRGIQESQLNIVMELGSNGAIKQAVMNNQGVAFINYQAVKKELETGLLVELPIKDFKLYKEFYLIIHRWRTPSFLLEAFLKFLKKYQ